MTLQSKETVLVDKQLASAVGSLPMIRGYRGDESWTAIPSTGKRQIVDPEGEFIPGETIIKLYYLKRIDG